MSPEEQTMTPADELRQAAATLREGSAARPPFHLVDLWIKAMPRDVAEPLAAMLEGALLMIENGQRPMSVRTSALDLARQINEATR